MVEKELNLEILGFIDANLDCKDYHDITLGDYETHDGLLSSIQERIRLYRLRLESIKSALKKKIISESFHTKILKSNLLLKLKLWNVVLLEYSFNKEQIDNYFLDTQELVNDEYDFLDVGDLFEKNLTDD